MRCPQTSLRATLSAHGIPLGAALAAPTRLRPAWPTNVGAIQTPPAPQASKPVLAVQRRAPLGHAAESLRNGSWRRAVLTRRPRRPQPTHPVALPQGVRLTLRPR